MDDNHLKMHDPGHMTMPEIFKYTVNQTRDCGRSRGSDLRVETGASPDMQDRGPRGRQARSGDVSGGVRRISDCVVGDVCFAAVLAGLCVPDRAGLSRDLRGEQPVKSNALNHYPAVRPSSLDSFEHTPVIPEIRGENPATYCGMS